MSPNTIEFQGTAPHRRNTEIQRSYSHPLEGALNWHGHWGGYSEPLLGQVIPTNNASQTAVFLNLKTPSTDVVKTNIVNGKSRQVEDETTNKVENNDGNPVQLVGEIRPGFGNTENLYEANALEL